MFGNTPQERAYTAPFIAFLAAMAVDFVVGHFGGGSAWWVIDKPRYWIYPLQTFVCAVVLFRYWRHLDLRLPRGAGFATFIGIAALVIWIAPQQWMGKPPRLTGFDPAFFGAEGWPYHLNVALRFLRLVIIVPLVEEIFWRGFLLRYLIKEDFTQVPFGTYSAMSFAIVTLGFTLEHAPADWPAAALTGVLFNLVAYRTRSLSACVLTHAVTNALLGIFVLRTGQWGFW